MKRIFEEAALGRLPLKNRLIRSATRAAIADPAGHMPEGLFQIYEELAKGGIACIVTGSTSVSDNDFCLDGVARLSNDGLIPEHQKLTELIHKQECPVLVQLVLGEYNRAEAGKLHYNINVDDLTPENIEDVKEMFLAAAERAERAGYDGVQILASNGCFLSRFISPYYNHRTDGYGGSVEKRAKLLVELISGICERYPGLHRNLKIDCEDFMAGGLTQDDSLEICKLCAQAGVESIEVSGNGSSIAGISAGEKEAYFKKFALRLAEAVEIPVVLVGGHRSFENMEKVLNEGEIAFLSMARPLIREPYLPNRWKSGDTSPSKCFSCNMCYLTTGHHCIYASGPVSVRRF